jgi:hypothetical protein
MNIGEIKKIGIALAAYEPDPIFFVEQLQSIQNQTFTNWICVITFDSPMKKVMDRAELEPFKKDPRFSFFENPVRLGHKKNFERSLNELLKFDLDAIACSDQDDIWYSEKLETCALKLSQSPPLSLVHSDMHILESRELRQETAWKIERRGVQNVKQHHLLVRNVVAGCSILMDVNILRKFPIIPEQAEFHDHWYALIAASFGEVKPIGRPLYAYRQHNQNVVAVSPFHGILHLGEKNSPGQLIKKMRIGFQKSQKLAQGAQNNGLELSRLSRFLFLLDGDCGFFLLFMGLKMVLSDPPLARACLARSLGKLLKKQKKYKLTRCV